MSTYMVSLLCARDDALTVTVIMPVAVAAIMQHTFVCHLHSQCSVIDTNFYLA